MKKQPLVAIIMGSDSDWPIMKAAAQMLADFDIAYTAQVVSAHRTPDLMFNFAEGAAKKGYQVIIAGAGGAAHRAAPPVSGAAAEAAPVFDDRIYVLTPEAAIVELPQGATPVDFAWHGGS